MNIAHDQEMRAQQASQEAPGLHERISELEMELEIARALLEKHQFAIRDPLNEPAFCPECFGMAGYEGHKGYCAIKAIITKGTK